jgi:hypothetical protein
VEWLKVKALSSNLSIAKKKKKNSNSIGKSEVKKIFPHIFNSGNSPQRWPFSHLSRNKIYDSTD